VLQDIHWSFGGFGYFATYSLGNLIAAMLWDVIQKDLPDLESQFEKAQFGDLLEWLRVNIHVHGAKYEPMELLKMVTGSGLDADPYMRYLKSKFGEIYKL
jgi:carboxypeptidase Taq